MNAFPPFFEPAPMPCAPASVVDAIEARWLALAQAAEVVAAIAGADGTALSHSEGDFAALRRERENWRRERVRIGVTDLAAIMETGIGTLLSIQRRDVDPAPAAEALWKEFTAACAAILALLPPETRAHSRDEY